ncbi:hypothetical protein JHK85_051295 [Glycine max]|uniref:Uncharacterized protein n=1 Tax=Glycine max TaxID=3847 RepID=K7MSK9_SOYBN|nr:hypothetical protein JHK85_051295 [Glycine max]KAH1154748.1 hypothetical protein GYH30_050157 [Glycine max]
MIISRTFTNLGAYTSFLEHKRLKMYIKEKPYHTNYSNLIVSSYYTYWHD